MDPSLGVQLAPCHRDAEELWCFTELGGTAAGGIWWSGACFNGATDKDSVHFASGSRR